MADLICRWRNSSIKQLNEFNILFPRKVINKTEGRKIVEKNWALLGGKDFFTTPYQLAAQMGVYYEDDSHMYPRFSSIIDLNRCNQYMQNWGRKYYAPNPYTRSMQSKQPIVINNYLVNWVIEHGDGCDFGEAMQTMFSDSIGNTDILINMINGFMDIKIEDNKVYLKEGVQFKQYSKEDVYLDKNPNDKKTFFEYIGGTDFKTNLQSDLLNPCQVIYYGAPGTGKSHTINEITEQQPKENVFRTTFHPDSDYSTFVGCYKPTTIEVPMRDVTGKIIKENGADVTENRIVYKFVPQSFTKAYLRAWQTTEPVYLVIEEINRGNCAQIFGDLFQLLDRKCDGFSEYPIKADNDLATYIAENLSASIRTDIPELVKSGEELVLPSNLYIWATMNTSDQSLFPIDSAFKRRWDWKYVPIFDGKKGWKIEVNGIYYDWWDFLQKINDKIGSTTNSEDKKLGYYFCKATNDIINAETFVSKVVFYIWNDVFKDFSEEADGLFKDDNGALSFNKFYTVNGEGKTMVVKEKIIRLLQNLGVKPIGQIEEKEIVNGESEEISDSIGGNGHKSIRSVVFPDGKVISTDNMTHFEVYLESLKKIGIETVYPVIAKMKYQRKGCPLISTEKLPGIINSNEYSYYQEGQYFIVKGASDDTLINILNDLNSKLDLGIIVNYE